MAYVYVFSCFWGFFCDLNLADKVTNCVIIAKTGRRGREPCHSCWWQHKENLSAILLVTFAEAWDVYLHIRDKRLFCHVGNSRVVFFLIEIRPWFSRKKNKTNNCHSLNSMSGNRLTTVKPYCETSSDGYLTMAMAEDQPLLTVGLRFPMQIKLCGRTYRDSCHHKTSSPPNSALLWLRWLDRSHFKWKKKILQIVSAVRDLTRTNQLRRTHVGAADRLLLAVTQTRGCEKHINNAVAIIPLSHGAVHSTGWMTHWVADGRVMCVSVCVCTNWTLYSLEMS